MTPRTIVTRALGTITVPDGYQWRIGVGPLRWPKAWASPALHTAAMAHDLAYDGPWTRDHLRRADAAFIEVYLRMGGNPVIGWALWSILRDWSAFTVAMRVPFKMWRYA